MYVGDYAERIGVGCGAACAAGVICLFVYYYRSFVHVESASSTAPKFCAESLQFLFQNLEIVDKVEKCSKHISNWCSVDNKKRSFGNSAVKISSKVHSFSAPVPKKL